MVYHEILSKLNKCEIRGVANNGFRRYVTGRNQVVWIKDFMNKPGEIKNGVSQGSVLGLLLSGICINSLCNRRFCGQINSFTDDTAICYMKEF